MRSSNTSKSLNILVSSSRQWNPGDEFILNGVQNLLNEVIYHPSNWVLYDRNPDLFENPNSYRKHRNGIQSNSFHHKSLKGFDMVVIAGTPEWHGLPTQSLYSLLRQQKIPIIILGVGFIDAIIEFSEDELYCFRKCAKIITTRDIYASNAFTSYKIPHVILPCPALFAANNVNNIQQQKRLGIIIQSDYGSLHKISKELMDSGISIAKTMKNKGYDVEFICFYIDEFINFISRHFPFPIRYSYDSNDYINILHEYDIIISTRLHGAILANSLCKPAFLINKDSRCTSTASFFPYIYQADSENIPAIIERIGENNLNLEIADWKESVRNKYFELLISGINKKYIKTK